MQTSSLSLREYPDKNPCAGVKLPQAGKRVVRTVLTPLQVVSISDRLENPYGTLVLFSGDRSIAINWSDFNEDVLHVCRRVYEGKADSTKTIGSNRHLPIPESLLSRMRALGDHHWVFGSREGTPINRGNTLNIYIRLRSQLD